MRTIILSASLFIAACGPAPLAESPDSASPGGGAPGVDQPQAESPGEGRDIARVPDGEARCPAATAPCMNEDNHAACLALAASCSGSIVQLESCPLQFACDDGDAAGAATRSDYDPCAGKSCGEPCTMCAPDDTDCVETMEVKTCDASGTCSSGEATCE